MRTLVYVVITVFFLRISDSVKDVFFVIVLFGLFLSWGFFSKNFRGPYPWSSASLDTEKFGKAVVYVVITYLLLEYLWPK